MSDSNESIMYSSQEETPATENEPNATFMSYYNKSGRKLKDNKGLINTIKDVNTIDNSYTQVGIKTQLENINFSVSRSKICKVMKQTDITRKRLKKESINDSFSRS
ncbi:hypothetical protein HZS_1040 [Henneguya salminicola]|nr:hypothetical protein HZS_1040 [Henneguya salminicola]